MNAPRPPLAPCLVIRRDHTAGVWRTFGLSQLPGQPVRIASVATEYPVAAPGAAVTAALARALPGWWIGYQDVPWLYKLGLTLPE